MKAKKTVTCTMGEAYLNCNLLLSGLKVLLKRFCVNGIVDIR